MASFPARVHDRPESTPRVRCARVVLIVVVVGLAVPAAHAVTIITGDGSGNTDAGGDPQFQKVFGNLDMIGNGAAVYIGNGFALRTRHAGSAGGGLLFGEPIISNHRLHEVSDPESLTDIVLMELANDPGLPALPIADQPPLEGTPVRLVGFGADREPDITRWNITGDYPDLSPPDVTWTWTETRAPGQADLSGYMPLISSGNQRFGDLRWGTNLVDHFNGDITFDFDVGSSNGMLRAFVIDFDESGGTPHEAQAVGHDSGGAVVALNQDTGRWELLGLMHAGSAYPDQPDATFSAVFGNLTFASDLSAYLDQILPFIPEPACATALLAGVLLARPRARSPR